MIAYYAWEIVTFDDNVMLNEKSSIKLGEKMPDDMTDTISMIKVKYRVSDYEIGKDCYTDFVTKEQIKVS